MGSKRPTFQPVFYFLEKHNIQRLLAADGVEHRDVYRR